MYATQQSRSDCRVYKKKSSSSVDHTNACLVVFWRTNRRVAYVFADYNNNNLKCTHIHIYNINRNKQRQRYREQADAMQTVDVDDDRSLSIQCEIYNRMYATSRSFWNDCLSMCVRVCVSWFVFGYLVFRIVGTLHTHR